MPEDTERISCAECGHVLYDGPEGAAPVELRGPEEQRTPCPRCGSTARAFEASIHAEARATMSVRGEVTRGVNAERIAVLALLLAVSIGVGAATQCVIWGLVAFAVLVAILAVPRTRHLLMAGLHRLTGR